MAAEEGVVIACHSKEEFESQMALAKESHKLVIIDFTASWCPPCRAIAPIFAEYAKQFTDAIFLKVDVDELKEVAQKYSVEAMPTFVFVKDGEKVHTIVGANKDEIHKNIKKHLGSASA